MYQFTETQRFSQWWLWLVMVVSILPIPAIWLAEWRKGVGVDFWEIVVISVILLSLLVLFGVMNLRTRIDSAGIHYKFFPLHFSERIITWDEVDNAYIRKYKPIGEYGGWGLKGTPKYGKAINVSGDMGLQLLLKNGKKILIGTQKADMLTMVLKDMGKV